MKFRSILVGTEGFEPTHDGIKTRCLTTWLRPNNKRDDVNLGGRIKKEGGFLKAFFA